MLRLHAAARLLAPPHRQSRHRHRGRGGKLSARGIYLDPAIVIDISPRHSLKMTF